MTNIILFSDKRNRETRLRRSVISIDDTDFLMEVQSARRRSILLMTSNDDLGLSSGSPTNWKQAWQDFSISPDNIRNMLPLNRSNSGGSECEEERILRNPIPELSSGKNGAKTVATADKSSSLDELSSPDSKTPPSSLELSRDSITIAGPEHAESRHPSWYNRLGAISRREHQQEKAYHDTLDDHHEATIVQALKRNTRHPYFQNWHRRKSSRDGLDFSRDVALAMRHNSIYAMADSLTKIPDFCLCNDDANENDDCHNGYIQDTRPAANQKTQKCVLDLIA